MKTSQLLFLTLCFFSSGLLQAQNDRDNEMSLLFIGDIMGHDAQIISAYDSSTQSYYYDEVFSPLKPIIEKNDFAIANLEVTLAGKPHKGYPQFSSPDELALACKNVGMDVLVTANNHSCDRGKSGILRTCDVLDFYNLKHTGTFRNQADKDSMNLLILEKGDLKVGLLNYTYGTNGLPFPKPSLVNLIDLDSMKKDISLAKKQNPDKLIVMIHWGLEYQTEANESQKKIAEFLFKNGVDIIIGSHPHVIQPMEYYPEADQSGERLVVYSLGNFVSNQRKFRTDGGAMVELKLKKDTGGTKVSEKGYYLTWVNKSTVNGKSKFEILPSSQIEKKEFEGLDHESIEKMKVFIDDSRSRLNKHNVDFPEISQTE
ncbi:MAG: CapA family protein [Cytophagales bacterium]